VQTLDWLQHGWDGPAGMAALALGVGYARSAWSARQTRLANRPELELRVIRAPRQELLEPIEGVFVPKYRRSIFVTVKNVGEVRARNIVVLGRFGVQGLGRF
jgi:hypothetical protein